MCKVNSFDTHFNFGFQKNGKTNKVIGKSGAHIETPVQPNGFDLGYTAEGIMGFTDRYNEICFLVKWKEAENAELVPASIAVKRIPEIVLGFYSYRVEMLKNCL